MILPIWHGVTREQVIAFSPPLADKLAIVTTGVTPQDVAIQIIKVIRPDIYRRHPRSQLEKMVNGEALRDSVTPHLSVRPNMKATTDGQVYDAEITVTNTGIGPAVIGSFQILVNGKAMTGHAGGWLEASTELGIENLGPAFYWLGKGDYIGAGETETLFRCSAQAQDRREIEILEQALRQLSIRIEYESVYGKRYEEQWSG